VVTTFAGVPGVSGHNDGTGSGARFWYPAGLVIDGGDNIYVADSANNTIRKITPGGVVKTLAGIPGMPPDYRDGSPNVARFNSPESLGIDSAGNLYVADYGNFAIRKVTPAGAVSTLAGFPGAGSADGIGTAAEFYFPEGITTDRDGNSWVADTWNHTIRKITSAGQVTTIAGLAGVSGNADGSGHTARFLYPSAVSLDSSGNLYVTDAGTTLRMITPDGVVTTLAGMSGSFGSANGFGSAARFSGLGGVTVDRSGIIYLTDSINATVRVARPALADAATIDQATGTVGVTRTLDTSPQNATSWEWSIIRRPSGSVANFSSTTVRNPAFTPDVADLYQFRLVAKGSAGTSFTIVSLQAKTPSRRHSSRSN
jgi:sugar lactone lactonase YvrE